MRHVNRSGVRVERPSPPRRSAAELSAEIAAADLRCKPKLVPPTRDQLRATARKRGYWFIAKSRGTGGGWAAPVAWQGWVVLLTSAAGAVASLTLLEGAARLVAFVANTLLTLVACEFKGSPAELSGEELARRQ